MRVDYRFREEDGGTRLDYSCELVRSTRFVRILFYIFGWLTTHILCKQLVSLKQLAEEAAFFTEPNDTAP